LRRAFRLRLFGEGLDALGDAERKEGITTRRGCQGAPARSGQNTRPWPE